MSALLEQLAPVACNAWFAAAELATRWPSASPPQRATFRAMVAAAISAGRAAPGLPPGGLEATVAEALSYAFLDGCEPWVRRRYAWGSCAWQEREAFLQVARAIIAAGQRLRQAQALAA